jgi:hypothetical protein
MTSPLNLKDTFSPTSNTVIHNNNSGNGALQPDLYGSLVDSSLAYLTAVLNGYVSTLTMVPPALSLKSIIEAFALYFHIKTKFQDIKLSIDTRAELLKLFEAVLKNGKSDQKPVTKIMTPIK